jgi:hypothetical protein
VKDGDDLSLHLAYLYLNSHHWMHRRVEALRMASDGTTRRHVSVDFTLPAQLQGSVGRMYLPLGLVQKGALRGFDTEGPDGRAAPVLGAEENAALAAEMLSALATRVLPASATSSAWLRTFIERITSTPAQEAQHWYRRYLAWARVHPDLADSATLTAFEDVLTDFISNFLLVVEINEDFVGTRSIVKYSYEFDLPSFDTKHLPVTLGFPATQFGITASWHFEVDAPPELGVILMTAVEKDPRTSAPTGRRWSDTGLAGQPRQLSHLACRPSHRFNVAEVDFVLTPLPHGLPTVMLWGAWTTLGVVLLGLSEALNWTSLVAASRTGSPAVSILLVGPALLLSWLSRTPEHVLTARLLRRLRRVLVSTAACLLGAAALAALTMQQQLESGMWVLLAFVQGRNALRAVNLYRSVRGHGYTPHQEATS